MEQSAPPTDGQERTTEGSRPAWYAVAVLVLLTVLVIVIELARRGVG